MTLKKNDDEFLINTSFELLRIDSLTQQLKPFIFSDYEVDFYTQEMKELLQDIGNRLTVLIQQSSQKFTEYVQKNNPELIKTFKTEEKTKESTKDNVIFVDFNKK